MKYNHSSGLSEINDFLISIRDDISNSCNDPYRLYNDKYLFSILRQIKINEYPEASDILIDVIRIMHVKSKSASAYEFYVHHDVELTLLIGEILSKTERKIGSDDLNALVDRFGFGYDDTKRLYIQRKLNQEAIEEIILSGEKDLNFKNRIWFPKFQQYAKKTFRIYKSQEWFNETQRRYKESLLLKRNYS